MLKPGVDKSSDIERRWLTTLKALTAVDIVIICITFFLAIKRFSGDLESPNYIELFIVLVVLLVGNVLLFFFMRTIKNVVKDAVKDR